MSRDRNSINPLFALLAIALLMGLLLGMTNLATKDIITTQKLVKAEESRKAIFPEAKEFTQFDLHSIDLSSAPGLTEIYLAKRDDNVIGYIFAASNRGYAGGVPCIIGINKDGVIVGIEVLDNKETPGLGTKIEEPAFLNRLTGKEVSDSFDLVASYEKKDGISAVTGATFSSKAVVNDVKDAVSAYEQLQTLSQKGGDDVN